MLDKEIKEMEMEWIVAIVEVMEAMETMEIMEIMEIMEVATGGCRMTKLDKAMEAMAIYQTLHKPVRPLKKEERWLLKRRTLLLLRVITSKIVMLTKVEMIHHLQRIKLL